MNVALVEYYVPGCGDCIAIVENIVSSAIRDPSVSHTKLVSTGNRHCHEAEKGPIQKRVAAGVPDATQPAATKLELFDATPEPEEVDIALRDSLREANMPNGFDANM